MNNILFSTDKNALIVRIEKARPGMILSDNVYSSNGTILLQKGLILTSAHILRLRYNHVDTIRIMRTEDAVKETDQITFDSTDSEQVSFELINSFLNGYLESVNEIEESIKNIVKKDSCDVDTLYENVDECVGQLSCKSDLIHILTHLKVHGSFTFSHCLNVSMLANLLGQWLKLPEYQIREVTIAGLLHDIGKLSISDTILDKPAALTTEEFDEIKKHSEYGYDMIQTMDIPESVKQGVLYHHERVDGSGYPHKLVRQEIPLYAKIIAIVDMFDAMNTDRVYRERMCPFDIIDLLKNQYITMLDTEILFTFLENISLCYIGSKVELNNGTTGTIRFIYPSQLTRPIIEINGKLVDLSTHRDLKIVKMA